MRCLHGEVEDTTISSVLLALPRVLGMWSMACHLGIIINNVCMGSCNAGGYQGHNCDTSVETQNILDPPQSSVTFYVNGEWVSNGEYTFLSLLAAVQVRVATITGNSICSACEAHFKPHKCSLDLDTSQLFFPGSVESCKEICTGSSANIQRVRKTHQVS